MNSVPVKAAIAAVLAAVAIVAWLNRDPPRPEWSDADIVLMRSLWLNSLPDLPPDPSNAVADNAEAAEFGRLLFFDTRLSANGAVSCATCHQPERRFTDGLQKGQAVGQSRRNTMSIVGTAYSPWLYWDGRRDSQWAQALSPLEDPNEHATDRAQVTSVISEDPAYRAKYESLFGASPDLTDEEAVNTVFANVGKVIAAFERTIMPLPSRFDEYVDAIATGKGEGTILSDDETQGLRLFIGEAECIQCHNGPLFTNNEFHNTGVLSAGGEVPDKGRAGGLPQAMKDPFNCRGAYSDDETRACPELEFVRSGPELIGAVRTPSLRNLDGTAPFMHKGQIATLAEVLEHYNEAPDAMIGHNEAKSLGLSRRQLRQLEAFLETLSAPHTGRGSRPDAT